MRNATFEVPHEVMEDFCQKLVESGLDNSIVNCDEDEISIEVEYDKTEENAVDKLESYLDDLIAEMDEDEEEEENDDDDR